MGMMLHMLATVGAAVLGGLASLGRLLQFAGAALLGLIRPPFRPGLIGQQMLEIGYFSLPVVGLTAAFSGLVLALQSYMGLAELASPSLAADSTPRVVLSALVQELGPVLAGLMIAGRVGAAMAAEIGTMRVTEQIDALHTLSTDPIAYLVSPRLIAATLMMPVLVLIADIIGTAGGFVLATARLGFNPDAYLAVTWETFDLFDVSIGLVKAAVFGFLIALISTYQGYHSGGGAQGVGRAATQAVVLSSMAILAANYMVTEGFFAG